MVLLIFAFYKIWKKMKHTLEEKKEAFARLLQVMDELREKCPWDSKQTFDSLRTLTIEEVYEPFLIKEGFLKRTPRGREATDFAYQHLGRSRFGGAFENSLF